MGIVDVAKTLVEVPGLLKLKKGLAPRPLDTPDCLGARVEANAANLGTNNAIIFEGQQVTWAEFNALANRYANFFVENGVNRGDTISIIMENRIEFLALIAGLSKIGVTAALINTNLRGRPLTHCISVTESRKCVVGAELADAVAEVTGELNLQTGADYFVVPDGTNAPFNGDGWATDLQQASADSSPANPAATAQTTLGETALYIFTSGTTGLPKAAVLSNRRFLMSCDLSAKAGLKCTPKDRLYLCLPLYHGTGLMIGAGAAIAAGSSMFIRRKFSARSFLPEIREHGCTCLVYIGELCRYLTNSEAGPDDHNSPLKRMIGNGLRPDVWTDFKQRYGVKRICEFYGSSEGNVAFVNLLNKDCTVGMTSAPVSLVQYDVHNDELVRDNDGYCIPVSPGEPGLLLGKITPDSVFEGYTDAEATEKKVLRDALEKGDAWFNTGDLMRTVDVGYTLGYEHYQFVDRVGDTFRWKSENVSTNEVGEIINGFPQVKFCNIYGVEIPGADGKAGMASINLADDVTALDL
ncbi:MAG: long-chain-acyl-CoA synthetase, partial [Pseudomonadota bacterium]